MRVQFGDCVLDSETRELTRLGERVHLSPKAFRLLELLLERRPKAVSKEQIHGLLWPRTFVEDTALTTLVKEARAAIGDNARAPRFVRTVPAFGYAFSGEAERERGKALTGISCRVVGQGAEVTLAEGDNILGRGEESVLWLDDETVSRRHARIRVGDGKALLEDLSSKNGTFLRGERLEGPAELNDGDEFCVGVVSLRFRRHRTPDSTRSVSSRGKTGSRSGNPSEGGATKT
ncbi:MAG: FHA domain-containing protein [Acidobacteriota bacterium]